MLEVGKVLTAAKEIADHDERVAFVEAHFALVDRPVELVETWLGACHCTEMLDQDEILARVRKLATTYAESPRFLSVLGKELDYLDYPEDCIEILESAIMRGDANAMAYEALGRLLLLRRGDSRGVSLVEQARALDPEWDKPRVTLAAHFLTSNPEHALVLLGDSGDTYACELRSMLLAASGNDEGAAVELDEALSHYETLIDARRDLCTWHHDERRYARSRAHARALLELPRPELEGTALERVENAILDAYRTGGGFDELVPWLRERCRDGIPDHLAWDIFFGLTSRAPILDFDLALRAAERQLATTEHDDDIQRWRVRIAELYALDRNDFTHLEALAKEGLADNAAGWAQLAYAFSTARNFDAAAACADRVLELDPDSPEPLDIQVGVAIAVGDLDMLHRLARALADAQPAEHMGYEQLARSHARRDEPREAVENGRRAIELDPLCNMSWLAMSEAYLVADDLVAAADAAERSHAIEAAGRGDDLTILRAALARDPGALEAALGLRYRHLSALPFPAFVEKLRAAARSMP